MRLLFFILIGIDEGARPTSSRDSTKKIFMNNLSDTDRLLDLKRLSEYSSLGIPTLRDYLRSNGLPYFKLKGKILVRLSEFNNWLESFKVDTKPDLDTLADDVLKSLKGVKSKK